MNVAPITVHSMITILCTVRRVALGTPLDLCFTVGPLTRIHHSRARGLHTRARVPVERRAIPWTRACAHRRVGRRLDLRRLGSVSIRILLRQVVLALAERASGPIRASLRHQRIADVLRAERLKCCCQARSSNNEEVEMTDTD